MTKTRDQLIATARQLRRNQTQAEQALWALLRSRQSDDLKFRRQQPIGPYIVDFVCFEHRLIVELGGGQHDDPEQKVYDRARSAWLREQGYDVLRFWNNEVLTNPDGVFEAISAAALTLTLPSPVEGEGKTE